VIVCKKCGNQNADNETFCTSCHAYLEWSGERVVEPVPEPPPAAPAPVQSPDFIDRVKQAVGLDKPVSEQAAAPPPAIVAPPATLASPPIPPAVAAPSAASAPFAAPPPPVSAPPPSAPAPSMSAVAPRPADIPAAVLPQAVAPAPERPRQAPKTDIATGQRYKPGDLICGQCGAGNSPERHFCQRCGANLTAAVVVKTPWYRKLFPARSPAAAGTRPAGAPVQRAWGAALGRVIGLGVVVVLVLGYLLVPPIHAKVNDTVASAYAAAHKKFQPTIYRESAYQVTASSQLTIHPARLTIDEITSTYWAANTAVDKQPWIRFTFASPVDLDEVLITTGAANDYTNLARPQKVHVIFSDKSTADLTLKDDPTPQTYGLVAHQVTYVEFHIVSLYPSAQSSDVAINEVEFVKIE
jgi:ribosomal protein L40E